MSGVNEADKESGRGLGVRDPAFRREFGWKKWQVWLPFVAVAIAILANIALTLYFSWRMTSLKEQLHSELLGAAGGRYNNEETRAISRKAYAQFTEAVREVMSRMWWSALIVVLLALLFIKELLRDPLAARAGPIVVTDQDLHLSEWPSKMVQIPWCDIDQMRAIHLSRQSKSPQVYVRTHGRELRISLYVKDRDELLEEIIARARLTEKRQNWYQTCYSRIS